MSEPDRVKWVGIRKASGTIDDIPVRPRTRGVTWVRESKTKSAGTIVLYTVPTGKVFYLIAAHVRIWHVATGDHDARIEVRDETDGYVGTICGASCSDADNRAQQAISFPLPLMFPEGWDIYLTTELSTGAYGTIFGWIESK